MQHPTPTSWHTRSQNQAAVSEKDERLEEAMCWHQGKQLQAQAGDQLAALPSHASTRVDVQPTCAVRALQPPPRLQPHERPHRGPPGKPMQPQNCRRAIKSSPRKANLYFFMDRYVCKFLKNSLILGKGLVLERKGQVKPLLGVLESSPQEKSACPCTPQDPSVSCGAPPVATAALPGGCCVSWTRPPGC